MTEHTKTCTHTHTHTRMSMCANLFIFVIHYITQPYVIDVSVSPYTFRHGFKCSLSYNYSDSVGQW